MIKHLGRHTSIQSLGNIKDSTAGEALLLLRLLMKPAYKHILTGNDQTAPCLHPHCERIPGCTEVRADDAEPGGAGKTAALL